MADTTWVTVDDIQAACGVSVRTFRRMVNDPAWPAGQRTGLGGSLRWAVSDLPEFILRRGKKVMVRQPVAAQQKRASAQQLNQRLTQLIEHEQKTEQQRIDTKREKGEAALAALASQLTPSQRARFDARLAIVQGYEVFFVQAQPIGRKASFGLFADEYNRNTLPPLPSITAAVRQAISVVSGRSVERWQGDYKRDGFAGLIDSKDGKHLKDVNVFTSQPILMNLALAILIKRPTITNANLVELLHSAWVDYSTGEMLFEKPSYWATSRFIKGWKESHPELYLAATNPDAWKNSCMAAVGNASEDVLRLNQRWEMDATPADWMLIDPESGQRKRYTCSAVIDVFSRRMLFVLSRTPRAQTHLFALRLALLAWGVPEEVVTDNGQDYLAVNFKQALVGLGIEHRVTAPFSPWEKPHVERGIGVMLHSILEVLPNFIGHNVAERQAIESRKAFSERLFKKDGVVELDMSPTQLQKHMDDWVAGTYHHHVHGGTGKTPFERAANWTGPVRRIQDERALDMLLAPLAGTKTLQKKGLQIEKGWYASIELFDTVEVGTSVTVRQTEDFGVVMIYQDGRFIGPAVCPERKGVSRRDLAIAVKKTQARRITEEKHRLKRASTIDPNQLVGQMLRDKAAAAGKLATMPARGDTVHQSQGLDEAAKAVDRMINGRATRLAPEMERALAARRAAANAPAPEPVEEAKVVQIPETPELRFNKWLSVNARVDNGEIIDDPQIQKWWGSYQQSNEFALLKRRYESAKQSNGAGAKVTAFAPVFSNDRG